MQYVDFTAIPAYVSFYPDMKQYINNVPW